VLLALIGVLYIASVPWYRDPDAPLRIVLGLPDWVVVAIGCYAAAACLNAAAWLLSDGCEEDEIGEPAGAFDPPPGAAAPAVGSGRESVP